jgi:uncharacterized membrane protein required for colicin V production
MNEFFANGWNTIETLLWLDWITLIILLVFLALGFRRGMAKEIINLGFLLLAIILAGLFYELLALSSSVTWLLLSHQSHMAVAFGLIFVGVLLMKKIIYQLIDISAKMTNPCVLNKISVYLILLIIALVASWHYLDFVANLGLAQIVITDISMRFSLSFIITFAFIAGIYLAVANVFNIFIDTSKPCILRGFFAKILDLLSILDDKLNAKHITGTLNNALGLLVGLIKGSLIILIAVLVLQNINNIAQLPDWNATHSILKAFQDFALEIRPILSEQLLFIRN